VNGESRSVEARSVIGPDGKVRAMVRAPVASFRSGDANRDAHMLEALDAAKHPFVVFKGIAQLDPARVSSPATLETVIEGEIELRGTRRPIAVPVSVEFAADGEVRVRGSFSFSLESHGIERPALLFVKIEDRCRIELDLALTEEKG
jgi:polyisoprenoid-binding protein YceI